jgi:hypothetical protein
LRRENGAKKLAQASSDKKYLATQNKFKKKAQTTAAIDKKILEQQL